ncbi:AAA family ATPase [Rhizobium sp. 9140]|uniref:AAA family ATPase n=1 Tax=Rhizobium sp. 9140 TaxID=1761900 RepID=UPI000792E795|nr:ATP-binding protein [Rhizobium sp. 9140]CZT38067.1 ATPase family associated with various cellular activities (AAA) [Rhizobium sp. 9140]
MMRTPPETVEARLMRYFLRRIRRLAMLDLFVSAHKADVLEVNHIDGHRRHGTSWRASPTVIAAMTGDPVRDRSTIGRLLKSSVAVSTSVDPADRHASFDFTPPPAKSSKTKRQVTAAAGEGVFTDRDISAATAGLLPIIQRFVPRPDVTRVAVSLLVARAAQDSLPDLEALRAALVHPRPIVLIKAPVGGFEQRFCHAMEDGLIAPFWVSMVDFLNSIAWLDRYDEMRKGVFRRKLMLGSGRAIAGTRESQIRRRLGKALAENTVPLVIADELPTALTRSIVDAADLVLECNGFDNAMLAELLFHSLGLPVSETISRIEAADLDLSHLHLDDLSMAIRPSRSLDLILETLRALLQPFEDVDGERSGGTDSTAKSGKGGSSKPASSPAVDIVQPEPCIDSEVPTPNPDAASAPAGHVARALRIETLTGYGAATGWARDLQLDLAVWREGAIGWSDMSTKLLLSGPPGTGKTTFARALCNSLGIPLVISSVTSWLEPGYLGDVLQRMSAAFTAAREHAPCILLIDEIDGIGSRSGSDSRKQYDDYWTSLINRLLELLDGALKSEGVIVVAATNHPDRIDPALLRSGRLEKHVPIPRPDIAALTGILAHHLGNDLAGVITTAPVEQKARRMRPRAARDGASLKVRQPNSSTDRKGPAHD